MTSPATDESSRRAPSLEPAPAEPDPKDAMAAARPPVGTGSSPLVAQLIALALIGLGILGIQEALVRTSAITSSSWTSAVVDAVDGLTTATWVLIVGAVLAVLGLLLLPIVFKRRPRKTVSLSASTGVYLRTRDLGRIAEGAIAGIDTVTDVSVKASRKKVRVTATTVAGTDRNADIADDVRARLAPCLGALEHPPRIKVSVTNEGLS
jgi:hypothetical protein